MLGRAVLWDKTTLPSPIRGDKPKEGKRFQASVQPEAEVDSEPRDWVPPPVLERQTSAVGGGGAPALSLSDLDLF